MKGKEKMEKWICDKPNKKCNYSCLVELECEYDIPTKCLFDARSAKWMRAPDEPEQKTVENTLPDWCKVGEWVYAVCYFSGESDYYKIREIKPGADTILEIEGHGADYLVWGNHIKQARLRPYNADEMRELVGKVVEDRVGNRCLISLYTVPHNDVVVFNAYCSAEKMLELNYTINGSPCGVLEHLENGEWVE